MSETIARPFRAPRRYVPPVLAAAAVVLAPACGPSKPDPGEQPVDPQVGTGGAAPAGDLGDPGPPGADEAGPTGSAAGTRPAGEPPRRLIPESAIEDPEGPKAPVEGRVFTGGERFRIEQVPEGVTFHLVGEDPATWEVRDAEGRRLALIQEEEWTEAMQPEVAIDDSAPLRNAAVGETFDVDDWGGAPATIVTNQLNTTLRLYRFERRAGESDWIRQGFRYEPTRVGAQHEAQED